MVKVFSFGSSGWSEIESPVSGDHISWSMDDIFELGFGRSPFIEIAPQDQNKTLSLSVRVFGAVGRWDGDVFVHPMGGDKFLVEVKLGSRFYYVFPDDFPSLIELVNKLTPIAESQRK